MSNWIVEHGKNHKATAVIRCETWPSTNDFTESMPAIEWLSIDGGEAPLDPWWKTKDKFIQDTDPDKNIDDHQSFQGQ